MLFQNDFERKEFVMNFCGSIYILFFSLFFLHTYADDWSDVTNAFNDAAGSVKDYAVNFGLGIGEAFSGQCLQPDCYYSFRVWNDTPWYIRGAEEDVKKVLGIDFDGDITESKEIPPYSHGGGIQRANSDGKFYHSGLYLKVALQFDQNNQNLYESYDVNTQVGNQNFKWSTNRRWNIAYPDPKNVYSYRMYTERHIVKAEYLGIKTTTNEFNGVFVNTTNEDAKGNVASQGQNVLLQFMKNNVNYQVTLEPGIFNILNSDANVPNSMRPKDDTEKRSLTFLTMDKRILAQIPLTPEAICNMLPDPKKEGAFIRGDPMLYTYEIFQGTKGISVGMQGLAVGHYKQTLDVNNPTKNVVRDINPLECHVWYQSPQDTQKMLDPKSTDVAFNPQEQVWISYVTKDSVVQKKNKSW